jgi:CRP-like cAMP-binding protein
MTTEEPGGVTNEQMRFVLQKNPLTRSFDDLLILKGFMSRSDFMLKSLSGALNPKQVNDLCRDLGLENYNNGDIVFNQGDIGDKVFILLDGACDLRVRYKIDLTQGESEIREKYIKTYTERGSYFGERALQFDEPRSATVISSAFTSLITVSKNLFVSVLRDAKEQTARQENITTETKENVIKVLSKMRSQRTNQELDISAGYLFNRIPFFQRFTMPQLVELCRVAETIAVESRSILFKQASIGEAFYVVLTGTVEVWVSKASEIVSPTNRVQHKNHEVTDGLGIKVAELVSGEIFGERALENESSMRMASIVTGVGNTELIIISREDYHNLVYVMMHEDSMKKLALLRRTELFGTTDVQHLRSLSRFLVPVMYRLNQPLYIAGTRAIEMIIIESGECRVEAEVRADMARPEIHENGVGYLLPTAQHDGQYHSEEHEAAPFREDPAHLHHPELHVKHPPTPANLNLFDALHAHRASSPGTHTHRSNSISSLIDPTHAHSRPLSRSNTSPAAGVLSLASPKKFALPKVYGILVYTVIYTVYTAILSYSLY